MCMKAPEFCSRNCPAQARLMLNEPLRWTSSTSFQSAVLILWKMTSRRIPALLIRISTRPKASSAALTIASAFFASTIDNVEAMASPPAFLISSTVSCAGPASAPAPCRLAPISQTTTRAPSCASPSAIARPIPRAPPVTIATLPATMPAISATPNLFRQIHDHPQLGPLLVLGERIAFLGGGETALRRERELFDVDELRRFLDPAQQHVAAFELAALGGDEAEHHGLALRHETQRLEAAGALAVVFHEIAVHPDGIEQHLRHRLVTARRHERRTEIAAAQMHGDRHVGGNVRHRRIDHVGVDFRELVGIVAARGHLLAQLRIAQIGQIDLVELQIAAAGVGQGADGLAVGGTEIAIEIVHRGIDRFRHRVAAVAEMQRRRRRDRHLRRLLGVRLHELEMLDHRMRHVAAELLVDAQQDWPRLRALELELALADIGFDAIEPDQEVGLPRSAAVFAVGDRFQSGLLLLLDQRCDLTVLDRLELRRRDPAALALAARLLQRRRAQQAADMIGAKRWFGSHHQPHTSLAVSTIIRSLAHCCSSASTLPSSVEAKPHCGERQNCSKGANFAASSMRRLMSSLRSRVPLLEVTRPSTTVLLPFGRKRSGSKPPARSVSYSRK